MLASFNGTTKLAFGEKKSQKETFGEKWKLGWQCCYVMQ